MPKEIIATMMGVRFKKTMLPNGRPGYEFEFDVAEKSLRHIKTFGFTIDKRDLQSLMASIQKDLDKK